MAYWFIPSEIKVDNLGVEEPKWALEHSQNAVQCDCWQTTNAVQWNYKKSPGKVRCSKWLQLHSFKFVTQSSGPVCLASQWRYRHSPLWAHLSSPFKDTNRDASESNVQLENKVIIYFTKAVCMRKFCDGHKVSWACISYSKHWEIMRYPTC